MLWKWLPLVGVYAALALLGLTIFGIKSISAKSGAASEPEPDPRGALDVPADTEVLMITLDESQAQLSEQVERGDRVRICAAADKEAQRPPGGWCGPVLSVADVDAATSRLALYVPRAALIEASPYIAAGRRVVMLAGRAETHATPGGGTPERTVPQP